MTKKINIRTCVISRQKYHKDQLIKFVIKEDKLIIDFNYTIDARGIYIANRPEIIEKLIKSNFFKKKYNINFNKELYDQLIAANKGG